MIHENLLTGIEIYDNQIMKLDNKWAAMVNHPQTKRFEDNANRTNVPSLVHCDHPSHHGEASRAAKPKTIECHGCGATVTIMEGEVKRCEYCDSTVS
ncbi:hypothetical protein D3C76_1306430 [compost metagenome]